jgi:predicted RNA-binding Zn-ribbon protein involved in translation (DUF1610 family)
MQPKFSLDGQSFLCPDCENELEPTYFVPAVGIRPSPNPTSFFDCPFCGQLFGVTNRDNIRLEIYSIYD